MGRSSRRRSSSRRARRRARRLLQGSVVLVVVAAFAVAAFLAGDNPASAPHAIETDDPVAEPIEKTHAGEERPVYRHSVVAGGVYDAAEVRAAIAADRVVAAHYGHLAVDAVRATHVTADRRVYMSYRKGDRIYWTRNPVRLPAGELVLTDGSTSIRARCGNCISEAPMAPTASEEPDAREFELVESMVPVVVPEGVRAQEPPGTQAGAVPLSLPTPLVPGVFAIGDLPVPTHGPTQPPTLAIPGPGVSVAGPPSGTAVPRPSTPPLVPPLPPPPIGPLPPPALDQPIPVPEPGTLILLGSGLGACALMRLRRGR